ncbi:hypothetical protein R9C00_21455 [Flammeovirgaceae bacterium SG7u.111]|nr:hypothetical protein [Flammeovirgaceae bacterium SG7u.132]WPO34269.1 hypothetical protein R9C00_21455 [Flammeovirgaceae bacterium SG7u.111]
MKKYKAFYSESSRQILVVLLFVIWVTGLILITLTVLDIPSEWVALVIVAILLVHIFLLNMANPLISLPCEVMIWEGGVEVVFEKTSILYPYPKVEHSWDEIYKVKQGQNWGVPYLQLKSSAKPYEMVLSFGVNLTKDEINVLAEKIKAMKTVSG